MGLRPPLHAPGCHCAVCDTIRRQDAAKLINWPRRLPVSRWAPPDLNAPRIDPTALLSEAVGLLNEVDGTFGLAGDWKTRLDRLRAEYQRIAP